MVGSTKYDIRALEGELEFLKDNPQFTERPATIEEFLGPEYLNIEDQVRTGVKRALIGIFGGTINPKTVSAVRRAIFTGGIGIGKTTFASIAIPYMVHWVSCLKNPQQYFGLMDGSRIAFMLMSTTENQAKEVLFGDIKARIEHSPWFKRNCMYDKDFKNQLRFPKDIWVLPGNSAETSFEGYNILGGILDEGDSHKQTANKDFAESGYDTIHARIDSRFNDATTGQHRGLLIVIGQMKKTSGFMQKKKEELEKDPEALVVTMAIWESLGWDKFTDEDGNRKSFYYDTRRKSVVPKLAAGLVDSAFIIEVPLSYLASFKNNPEKALRDLAGIPPAADSPFISLVDRIDECHERWEASHRDQESPAYVPVGSDPVHPSLHREVVATDTIKRVAHIDIAVSANGDALGLAMGHVSGLVEIEDELKPYITFDFLMRIKAAPGTEIILGDIRRILYEIADERKFKLAKVTMDGFQCLTGDTRVPLFDGRVLTMKELAELYPEGGVSTYTVDSATGKITAGKLQKAWKTSTKEVLEVHLDNGEVIRCTPDHRFMLRNGSYVEAQDLLSGQSLMPLYRQIIESYEQIAQPTSATSLRWQYTHRAIAGEAPEGFIRHHKDHNKLNNDPSNLDVILRSEHNAHHNRSEFWTDERRESVGTAISKSNTERTGLDARRRRLDVTIEDLRAYAHLSRREVTLQTGWSQDIIYARLRENGFRGWAEFRKMHIAANNHKVVKVVRMGDVEDVYDLSIETHQNFALESGVFVHNSTDTRQQLNKRKIPSDYLSVDKTTAPYYDLREAIYERRVEWPEYITFLNRGDVTKVNIANKELRELSESGHKVDHPQGGSKDVADCLAGVVYTLMGDRQYRRVARVARTGYGEPTASDKREPFSIGSSGALDGGYGGLLAGLSGLSAPIPPTAPTPQGPQFPSWHK